MILWKNLTSLDSLNYKRGEKWQLEKKHPLEELLPEDLREQATREEQLELEEDNS